VDNYIFIEIGGNLKGLLFDEIMIFVVANFHYFAKNVFKKNLEILCVFKFKFYYKKIN
jgi:hypothetical protein